MDCETISPTICFMREMLLQSVANSRQTDHDHCRLMAYGRQHDVDTVGATGWLKLLWSRFNAWPVRCRGLDSAERLSSITWSTVSAESPERVVVHQAADHRHHCKNCCLNLHNEICNWHKIKLWSTSILRCDLQ